MSEVDGELERWKRFKERAKAQARLFTFEGAVEELEALCLQYAPGPGTAPERYSDGWYAGEIIRAIGAVRSRLEQGRPSNAAAQAFTAGYLAGNWPSAQKWREQQEARRRGGSSPKHLPGVQELVDQLAAKNPKATARELWDLIPESRDDAEDCPIGDFIIYRDGSEIIKVEDATSRERSVKRRSFSRYVARARSK